MKKVDSTFEDFQLNSNERYYVKYSYRKYFWRLLFSSVFLLKLIQMYLINHPKIYRVFQILMMQDLPKNAPMWLKTFLNQKIPAEYLTAYPLLGLITLIAFFMIWWMLVVYTSEISINYKFIEMRIGILNKNIDTVDLVQIRDQIINTPWYDRILGLGNLRIESKDISTPHLELKGLDSKEAEIFMNFVRENSYLNMTDLRRAQIVESKVKKEKSPKHTDSEDDGEGYND